MWQCGNSLIEKCRGESALLKTTPPFWRYLCAVQALILTGPSGSGKTTIGQRLLSALPQLTPSISATTRPPRPGEIHRQDYYFLSEEAFDVHVAAGDFLEWERLYSGYRYGTLWEEVRRPLREGKIPLFIKDVKGTKALMQALEGRAFSVFILPPSIEVLEARLRQRGDLSEEALQDRLCAAYTEIAQAPHFSAILHNDDIDKAVARLLYHLRQYL